jgi:O-antigen ligase
MRTVALWLSLFLIFVIPWEDAVLLEGLGTIGKATGLLAAAFWIATVVVTGRFRKPHSFLLAVYLFVLWNTMSVFWSVDIENTIIRLVTYFQLVGLVWILWDLYTTPVALKAGLQAYVLGAYVSIGSLVSNYLAVSEGGPGRYTATGFNENDIGLTLALGIPVAWHLALSKSNSKKTYGLRLINYAYIPAAMLAILLTASRGSLVATLPALVFIFGSLTRLKPLMRVLLLAALILSLFMLQSLVPQSSVQRLATTGTSIAEGDIGHRSYIWREGITIFAEHPILGIGSGAFRTAVESGRVAHNSFLSVLVEVGIVGFVLLVITLAVAVHPTMRQPKWDTRFWLALLLVLALGNSVHSWEKRKPVWLFLGLATVSASLPAQHDEFRLHSELPVKSAGSPGLSVVRRAGPDRVQSSRTPGQLKPGWKGEKEAQRESLSRHRLPRHGWG